MWGFLLYLPPYLLSLRCRHLTSYLHFLDVDGDGCFSFVELAHALHLPDLKLPSRVIIKGGQFKKPTRPSADDPQQPTKPRCGLKG